MTTQSGKPTPWVGMLLCAGGAAWMGGCGTQRTAASAPPAAAPPSASRPMVLWNAGQSGDLYWNGQITASDGRRWDVGFLPGIAPTGQVVADSWSRGGDYYAFFFPDNPDHNPAGQCWRFTSRTMVKEFLVDGIAGDMGDGKANIVSACQEKPFGWPAAVAYYAIKDFVLLPTGRLVVGAAGAAAGGAATAICGTGQAVLPTVLATGDIATVGTVYPVARLVWHHPAWALSELSAEPKPDQDGRWTLRIISAPVEPVRQREAETGPRLD